MLIEEMPPNSLNVRGQHQAAAEIEHAEPPAVRLAVVERRDRLRLDLDRGRRHGRLGRLLRCVCAAAGSESGQHRDQRDGGAADASRRHGVAAYLRARRGPDRGSARRRATRRSACGRDARAQLLRRVLVEQLGELVGHRAAELLGVDDGDGAAVVARHVVADADGDQLDRRAGLDLLDHPAQVALEIVAGIDRQRGVVDRRAVGDHHQDLALLGARRAGACAPSRAPRRRCSP